MRKIQGLSDALCAPVGGIGPAVSSAASSFLATYTGTLPATPIIVVPTGSPTLDITNLDPYPACDAQCAYVARAVVKSCDTRERSCRCSPEFRGMTAECVELSCSTEEENCMLFYQPYESWLLVYLSLSGAAGLTGGAVTNHLDDSYCGPLYVNNVTLSSSVAAAIASGTQAAQSKIATATATGGATLGTGTNSTLTGTTGIGMPSPTPFTGDAGTTKDYYLGTAVAFIAGITVLATWL
ncbi:MAG: hypothetical protein Q9182_006811 [Xanthomendoza sp. 2 TL-2023]